MTNLDLFERANDAAVMLRSILTEPPRIAIVLGSGLGALADRLAEELAIPYGQIPHFPATSIEGHPGTLLAGTLGTAKVVVLQGRVHSYEGRSLDEVTFPVRVLQRLGVATLIVTAATGGIAPGLSPGALVCVSDHLNLLGANPLRGPNDDRLGPRFPDMTEVYSARLRALAGEEARALGLDLVPGVYACLPGPSYETPAEIRMLRALGADVVGMSTVPEAIVARHAGMDVLALAVVSNAAAGITGTPITHDEVIEAGRRAAPQLGALVEAIVRRLAGAEEVVG